MGAHQTQADTLISAAVDDHSQSATSTGSLTREDRDRLLESETFTLHGMSSWRATAQGVSPLLFLN